MVQWLIAGMTDTNSHPNLQMSIICHSGGMGLSGRETGKTGIGLCHSGLWTLLDVFI